MHRISNIVVCLLLMWCLVVCIFVIFYTLEKRNVCEYVARSIVTLLDFTESWAPSGFSSFALASNRYARETINQWKVKCRYKVPCIRHKDTYLTYHLFYTWETPFVWQVFISPFGSINAYPRFAHKWGRLWTLSNAFVAIKSIRRERLSQNAVTFFLNKDSCVRGRRSPYIGGLIKWISRQCINSFSYAALVLV